MAIFVTTLTYDSSTNPNHKGWAQNFGIAFSTLGWVSSGDQGAINYNGNYGTASISNVAITSNVLTLTFTSPTNSFANGQVVLLSGLTTNTFLNGQYITVTGFTTTTVTANFTHTNVVSVADTGTMTISYGWLTSTGTPDITAATFPVNHTFRFRGAYVAVTPTFTNLQTTNNLTTISFGTAGHGLDLNRTVNQGLNISGVVNASFTFLNTNPTGGWPIFSLTASTIVINTGSSPRADIASTAVSAGTGNPVYSGASAQGSICDTALYSGDLYIAITSNFTNVTPGTNTADWKRIFFDIWTSNDTLSSTNKLYAKFLYGTNSSFLPQPYFYFGSSTDGLGNITTNYNWGTTTPVAMTPSSTATSTAEWESDFSGASGRFAGILWRGYSASTSPTSLISIERSHDNSGNDTDAYWSIFVQANYSSLGGGLIHTINTSQGQAYNNSIPVLPVFPLAGYVGNPSTNVISMRGTDTGEGALVTTTLYGNQIPFLMSERGALTNFGTTSSGCAAGIRWN